MIASPKQTIWIEFAGLPGAGKTAIANALAEKLKRMGLPVMNPVMYLGNDSRRLLRKTMKLYLVMCFLLFCPVTTIKLLPGLFKLKQSSWKDFIAVWINFLFICGLYRKLSCRSEIYIVDQGLFQALWSIGMSAKSKKSAYELFGLIPFSLFEKVPIVVIEVNADLQTINQRLEQRTAGMSRIEKENMFDNVALLIKAQKLLQGIYAQLQKCQAYKKLPVDCYSILNNGNEVDSIEHLVNKIIDYCKSLAIFQ